MMGDPRDAERDAIVHGEVLRGEVLRGDIVRGDVVRGEVLRGEILYPRALEDLPDPPQTLYFAGSLIPLRGNEAVAIVGARKASAYGLEMARALGRDLADVGFAVISGMAHGIDAAAHAGALEADGWTIAVLAAGAEKAYPPAHDALYRQIVKRGLVLSEEPPGTDNHGWRFLKRNRLIAALAVLTIVVEASERSGALATAAHARSLGRPLGAVPGRVGSPQAAGPNALLAAGASVIRGVQDVFDVLYGPGTLAAPQRSRPPLQPAQAAVLDAIAEGYDSAAALSRAGIEPEQGLATLAALELGGHIVRGPGGRFTVAA